MKRILKKLIAASAGTLALGGLLVACAADTGSVTGSTSGHATEVGNCWSADAKASDGAAYWDRATGRQLAFVQVDPDGKRRVKLAIDDVICNLTGGRDDFAPAFSPDGDSYAFLSTRAGDVDGDGNVDTDIYVVDTAAGPNAVSLNCSTGDGAAPLSNVAPLFASDRIAFATKRDEQAARISSVAAISGGCEAGFDVLELPVVPTLEDLFTMDFSGPDGGGLVSDATQARYDAILRSSLDALVQEKGSELAALGFDGLSQINAEGPLADFRRQMAAGLASLEAQYDAGQVSDVQYYTRISDFGYDDRLDTALRIVRFSDGVAGMALDPDYPAVRKLAVVTAMTGLTIYEGISLEEPVDLADITVATRIAPSDVQAGGFGEGVSWQGSRIAFSVSDYQTLPRTLVFDAARQLTDAQIASTVADTAKQWGPLGIARVAGGLVIDHDLDGEQPALGPDGGRGSAPPDDYNAELLAYSHYTKPYAVCESHGVAVDPCDYMDAPFAMTCRNVNGEVPSEEGFLQCDGYANGAGPSIVSRLHFGNHWDVAQGADRMRPLQSASSDQTQSVFRP